MTTRGFTHDNITDTFHYHYNCGHEWIVTGTTMARGGQVAPPLCPQCHGQDVIDKMEYQNWRLDARWNGYAPGEVAGIATVGNIRPIKPTGYKTWLEFEVTKVREKAWH